MTVVATDINTTTLYRVSERTLELSPICATTMPMSPRGIIPEQVSGTLMVD